MKEFNARDFGAEGVAEAKEELVLTNLNYKWFRYPPGLKATIYHAKEGKELDSGGIQRAIDAAHAAGGGTVTVSAGDYLIGPIRLKSRVCLHLEPGAKLWGSPVLSDYRVPEGEEEPLGSTGRFYNEDEAGGRFEMRRLISAYEAEDISITGHGMISGQSPKWVIPWMNAVPTEWETLRRPTETFLFLKCKDVRVSGIHVRDTPSWSVVFDCCRQVTVQGIDVRGFDLINSDGIDLVNTSDATISDCQLHVTDDGVCLKNFSPDETMGNITVTNCVIRTLCNGLKIGTETIGNVDGVTFSNIVVHNLKTDWKGADGGININAVDGGTVRNINVSNVVIRGADCAFYLVASDRQKKQEKYRTPRAGKIERVFLSNITAEGTKFTCFAVGHPTQPIRHLHISNVHVRKTEEFKDGPPSLPVRPVANQYPNPFMFGSEDGGVQGVGDGLPAHGLFLRDVNDASVRDFRVDCAEPDGRHLLVQQRCERVELENVKSVGDAG